MNWLAELGKDSKMIVIAHKHKNGNVRSYNGKKQSVREYKQQYYLNNIDKYRERNREASQKRTVARIEALSQDAIMDEMEKKLNKIEINNYDAYLDIIGKISMQGT
jgi:hypothetical protein